MKKISIIENGVWAGTGKFRNGVIEDCGAVLGGDQAMAENAYDAIEQAIEEDEISVIIDGCIWEWEIIED